MFAFVDCRGQRIVVGFDGGQDAVDDEMLLVEADGGQFFMSTRHLAQGRLLGARDQHETGLQRIGQGFNRRLVLGALFFQSGQRAETRGVALARFQKARPGARQLQQANGMTGGRGVENDVLEIGGERGVGQ